MSMLELGGRRFTIPMGEVVLGSDPQSAISLTGPGLLPRHALLVGQPDGQVVIRKATPEADVMINGVRLGAEPTPLLHGDKLQVAGHELTFVDERRSGSTQFVPAMMAGGPPGMAPPPKPGSGSTKSVGTTGGRLVSLTDGREYVIMSTSLVMGREAGCDVVVPGKDVSRRHAEIVPSPKGYLLVDSSTNGVFVNDARVPGQRVLTRGDVIRIGEESFRFYSDAVAPAAAAPAPAAPPSASPAPPAPPAPPPPPPPAGAESRLQNTSFGMPVSPRPGVAPANPGGGGSTGPLANFLVRSGALKGTRLVIKTPIVNIGRADYNDLVIPDESVSTSHAKLQRREGVWVLVDLESTNGTFVDGERIKSDTPIAPGTMVRFGDIQLVFEPTDDALGVAKGGGTKVLESLKMPPTPPPASGSEASTPTAPPQPPPRPAAKPSPAPPATPAAKPAAAPKGPPPKPAPGRRPGPPAGQTPQKKGGCGSSAAVIVLATSALLYWILA